MTPWPVYEVLGIKPRALCVPGNHSINQATSSDSYNGGRGMCFGFCSGDGGYGGWGMISKGALLLGLGLGLQLSFSLLPFLTPSFPSFPFDRVSYLLDWPLALRPRSTLHFISPASTSSAGLSRHAPQCSVLWDVED